MNFLFVVAFVLGCAAFVFKMPALAIAAIAVVILGTFDQSRP